MNNSSSNPKQMYLEIILPAQPTPKPKLCPDTEKVEKNDLDLEIDEQTIIVAEVIGFYGYPRSGHSQWGLNPKNLHFTSVTEDFIKMWLTKTVNKEGIVFSLLVTIEVEDPDDGTPWNLDRTIKVESVREVKDYPHV